MNMNKFSFFGWGAVLFLALHVPSMADDTDIYVKAAPPGSVEPMVFITLDYRPNLGSVLCSEVSPPDPGSACGVLLGEAYDALDTGPGRVTLFDGIRAVFKTVFDELDGIQVALMMNHDDSCSGPRSGGGPLVSGCSNGAYFLHGLNTFDETDSNGAKATMLASLASLPIPTGGLSHSYQGKELYFELFRYLTGQEWHNAHTAWTDFGTSSAKNLDVDYPLGSWDTSIEDGRFYKTPFTDSSGYECSQAYAINLMFQVSNQEDDADSEITASKASGGMGIGIGSPTFPDIIEYMYDSDLAPDDPGGPWPEVDGNQNLTSYFITAQVNNTTNSFARAGGTFSAIPLTDPTALLEDLRQIFQEILSVSTTFVAASVPVNVFNRSDIVDNIFIAQFQVDEDARPLWSGNLKKLKLLETTDALGSTTLSVVDSADTPAIAADGRISYNSLTYWTDGASLPAPVGDEIAGKDGRSIERGGAGQKIPGYLGGAYSIGDNNGPNTRTVYTEPAVGTALMDLEVSNASTLQSDLGAGSVADAEELIQWLRGIDVDDVDGDGSVTDPRPWLLGAPLHSRPLPLNYGARSAGYNTTTNPDIRIFMGTEDGFIHAFRNTTSAGAEAGVEDWAFMPRSVMDRMETLRRNSPGTHPYTVDGAPAAYVVDADSDGTIGSDPADKAYLYFGMRRGGNAYYALDVTNPDAPSMLWSIDNTGDFAELGMTFSSPRIGSVKFGATPTPVIIFGGGYDGNKDSNDGNDSEGNAIYVVNAATGALVWKTTNGATTGNVSPTEYNHVGMVDGIPSDLAAVDTNNDGNIDRLYVGDTGGTVWRVDMPEGNTDNRTSWFATELANLGRDDLSPDDEMNDRRFFHRPDFVPSSDNSGAFDGILIGSGNRADPRDTDASNWFYMIKDRNVITGTVSGSPVNHLEYSGANPQGLGDITNTCIDTTSCTADLNNGWKLALEGVGEKSLAPAVTAFGTVYFTAFLPEGGVADAGTACAPSEGGGRLYAVKLSNGAPVKNYDTSDGSDDIELTKYDRFDPLKSGGIPAEVVPIGGYILPPDLEPEPIDGRAFWKTFWLEKDVDPEN